METLTPDICVIGAGAAGLSVAAGAAAFGVPAVLVERGAMGGECLHTGCVPSKALLAAASRAERARKASAFGIDATVHVDIARVMAHVRQTIAAIAPIDSAARFTGLGVRVVAGQARFADRRSVVVDDRLTIRARRFVIATGSTPAVPTIPGLDAGSYLTSDTIFALEELPARLLVIGAGPTGLELAQAFRRLGSAVAVFDAATPLAQEDPEAAAIVVAQLAREGVVVRGGVEIRRVSHEAGAVTLTFKHDGSEESISGSHLLVAAGRKPRIDGLALEAAGVAYGPAGIVVKAGLRTSNRRIYAIGDVAAGRPRFTHAASYEASLVLRNILFRLPARMDDAAVPHAVFTSPELAQAGLTEAQARAGRWPVHILRWPLHENDRARAERETHGHIKIITNRRGRILGATIVGAQAGELIAPWCLAIARRLNIRVMAKLVLPYPTMSEVGKRAAFDYFSPRLTRAWVRRTLRWLRFFG